MAGKEAGETPMSEAKTHSKGFLKKATKDVGKFGKKAANKGGKSPKGGKY